MSGVEDDCTFVLVAALFSIGTVNPNLSQFERVMSRYRALVSGQNCDCWVRRGVEREAESLKKKPPECLSPREKDIQCAQARFSVWGVRIFYCPLAVKLRK